MDVFRQRAGGQHDLAELIVVKVLCDHQRLREANIHAFIAFQESGTCDGQGYVCHCDTTGATIDDIGCKYRVGVTDRSVERGHVEALVSKAGHTHHISERDEVARTREDEDTVRGSSV